MSFLYFAYGSNMLSSRLFARCPSARVIGTAMADQCALEFTKKSLDGSAKANLAQRSGNNQTPGVVFEIDLEDRAALDRFEGAGKEYDRIDEFDIKVDGQAMRATTYIATATFQDLVPFDWYLALVLAGALEHDLGDAHVGLIAGINHQPDPDISRFSRIAALAALAHHGHHDPAKLLSR